MQILQEGVIECWAVRPRWTHGTWRTQVSAPTEEAEMARTARPIAVEAARYVASSAKFGRGWLIEGPRHRRSCTGVFAPPDARELGTSLGMPPVVAPRLDRPADSGSEDPF